METEVKENARIFAKEIVEPRISEMEKSEVIPEDIRKEMFNFGLMGMEIPEEYEGNGLNFSSTVVMVEEISKVDSSSAALADVQNTLVNRTIIEYGNEAQKKQYLPKLATEIHGSFCLSEPGSGSDAFALSTKADKKGDRYVLNGEKMWITGSKEANMFIVMATIDKSLGYKGVTAFLVDESNPGIRVGKPIDKLGLKASSTCPVILENCEVPETAVLGEVGKGYKMAIETLNEGRIAIGAQLVGLAQGAFDYVMPYMRQRKQFGKYIGDFQGMEFQYAQAATEIEAAKLLVYEAMRRKEAGLPFVKEAAMAKYYAGEVAGKVATQAVQWMGGVGVTKEYRAEKYYRDWILGSIYEGTGNINLLTIAKHLKQETKDKHGL